MIFKSTTDGFKFSGVGAFLNTLTQVTYTKLLLIICKGKLIQDFFFQAGTVLFIGEFKLYLDINKVNWHKKLLPASE